MDDSKPGHDDKGEFLARHFFRCTFKMRFYNDFGLVVRLLLSSPNHLLIPDEAEHSLSYSLLSDPNIPAYVFGQIERFAH